MQIIGTVVNVIKRGDWLELDIKEHTGIFQSTGIIRLVANNQAMLDLHRAATGQKVRGGNIMALAENTFKGKGVVIRFR